MSVTVTREEMFERALAADYRLRALDGFVRRMAASAPSARSGKPQCSSCVWEAMLKPLVVPLLGWERGSAPEQALDPGSFPEILGVDEMFERYPVTRTEPGSETERWLRTSEAFDAVTDVWLEMLDEADPGNGHGVA